MTKPKILIVEDEVIVARDIREQLIDLGYEPLADVATGEEALELIARTRPDLVLMDVHLAGEMDGIAVAQIVRDRFSIPVVFLTAFAGEDTLRRAKMTEPFGYILKPFDERELRTVIEMALYKHDAETRLRASEQKLQTIVEHSTQLFYSHTTANVLTYVSPQCPEFLDCEPEEALRDWQGFLTDHPANAEGVALTRAAVETGQRQRPYELELRTKRGRICWVDVRESPVVVDGKTVGIVGALIDITEGKRAQDQLRLQGAALSAAANAIVITDCNGSIVWVNAAFSTLTGYELAEALGKNPRDLVKSGQTGCAVYGDLWTTICSGRVWQGELINRRKDGSFYPEEQTITPVRGAGGEITHFIAIKQNLTEKKAADEMVQTSRRHFQAVFEQAGAGMIIAEGPRGIFRNVNRSFCEMVGYSAEELRHLSSDDITHPDDLAADRSESGQIHSGPIREFTREKRYLHKDGSEVWSRVFVAPLDPSEEHPTMRIGVIVEITARKHAEEALRRSEEHYRSLFENNPLPMWVYHAESLQFLGVNESAVQHYGFSREEFLRMTIKEIRPKEDIPVLLKVVVEGRSAPLRTSEWRHRCKDGTIIQVEITSRPLVFNGQAGRLVVAMDITERKLLEQKFFHAQRLESIGMLAAGIAHDLNNVLAPIVFAAPMLRESLTSASDHKILDILEHSAGRGAELVKQILGFTRTAHGGFQPTQVKHLARDVVSVIEATFPKSIQLDHQIPSDLWPVHGNATQIHQVLLNLCVNARDAMPHGGVLTLNLANHWLNAAEAAAIPGARPGAWLVLDVGDTGTGIPPEILSRIWEPFFTTKEAGKGTGLGLSTVRGIVAGHEGFVDLKTEANCGTAFRVFLPAVADSPAAVDAAVRRELPLGNGELALVVDDDAGIREIIEAILVMHGYRVVACADGVEALAEFTRCPSEFSAVITDVDMPRLGGVALARALLHLRPEIRLLAISGLSRNESGTSDVPAVRDLVHGFLLKPFMSKDLLGALHSLLHPSETLRAPCPPS